MNWLRRLFRRIEEILTPVIDSPSVRGVAGLLLLCAVFAGLLLSIQRVPEWQAKRASVRSAVVNPEARTTPADVAALQNEMRKTYLQVVGGAFALFALYLTFRRVKVAEQGHITDRYTKAIEQLGALTAANKPNVEVRLGAIYALERIAFDSPRDHWPVMEVLTAYVRQNAPAPAQIEQGTEAESKKPEKKIAKEPATEIQAILTVLGRRKLGHQREDKNRHLDLSYSDLDGAIFVGAHLDATSFEGAHLDGARFNNTHLEGATFVIANLEMTFFKEAHLNGAIFVGAHLDATSFEGAHLDGARFFSTTLTNVYFRSAYLTDVDFHNATIRTSFGGAHLAGANFRDAQGLTVEHFAYAKGVDQAYFDEAFRSEVGVGQNSSC